MSTSKIYSDSIEEIGVLVKAHVPLIWVVTHEEERFIQEFTEKIVIPARKQVWHWSLHQGLIQQEKLAEALGEPAKGEMEGTINARLALQKICSMKIPDNSTGICYLMKDFNVAMNEPVPRMIRDIQDMLTAVGKSLIIISPSLCHGPGNKEQGIPSTLEKLTSIVYYELPTRDHIKNEIKRSIDELKDSAKKVKENNIKLNYTNEEIEGYVRALQGLTMPEITDTLATSIIHKKMINQDHLLIAKEQIVRKSDILEYWKTSINLEDIGGMDLLKSYLQRYINAHSEKAKLFGVEPLKAVLCLGIPGCLTGDTVIAVNRKQKNSGCRDMTLEALYHRFNGLHKEGVKKGIISTSARPWDGHPTKTRALKYDQGYIGHHTIKNVIFSGIKEVFRLRTATNSISATADHRFLTPDGWKKLSELLPGDELLCRSGKLPGIQKILSIESIGERDTYDITMESPYDNFVANDFIVHNSGKSLFIKGIGNLWSQPLLRLDIGKVMGSLVGLSEQRMRDALSVASACAPCILWVDEIEKALSGTKSSNFSDGGTMSRVFGTLLTAMQEGLEGVTLFATANDISQLPPELIRRFDEVFFVDLPGPEERWEVFEIHLKKRGRNLETFLPGKDILLEASNDYTGAEIEKAIKCAIASAFCAEQEDLTVDNLLEAIHDTKPISQVMEAKIRKMREHAKETYRYASSWAAEQSKKTSVKTNSGKKLDIEEALGDLGQFTHTPKEQAEELKSKGKRISRILAD